MKKYKPEYMGKAMPTDSNAEQSLFLTQHYDDFSKCYDALKDYSEDIKNISNLSAPDKFKLKIITENDSIFDEIQEKNPHIKVENNIMSVL